MTSDDRILVLADDLTGALEVGAKFAQQGIATVVTTQHKLPFDPDDSELRVLVIDTETRHLPPPKAAKRISALTRLARRGGFSCIYKKTDSTLRGNIASELEALLKVSPNSPLIYVPAYPRMGRTVRHGTLYLHGVPVGQTDFAADKLNPVRESHIPTLIASQCSVPVFSIDCEAVEHADSPALYICNAETEDEIARAAAAFGRSDNFHLAAGTAAFAGCLAEHRMASQPPRELPRGLKRGLVVCGSRNEVSAEQLNYATHHGFALASPARVPTILAEGGWVILKLARRSSETSLAFAERTSGTVCRLMAQKRPDVLTVFGGDTAYSITRALGRSSIRPLGEIVEGIPLSWIQESAGHGKNNPQGLYLVTKAGGFGSPDVLVVVHKILSGE